MHLLVSSSFVLAAAFAVSAERAPMAHGTLLRGAGCDTFDKLGTIDAWVAKGTAPERIVASKVDAGAVVRTRPLCAWPAVARYQGSGSFDERPASPAHLDDSAGGAVTLLDRQGRRFSSRSGTQE